MENKAQFRFIERIMIQHAHPVKLASDIVGVLIGWYFLWTRRLPPALIAIFGASVIGTLLVWKKDVVHLYTTPLGRWMIGQAEPINLVVRSIGFLALCYGFWSRKTSFFPFGVITIITARFLGTNAKMVNQR